MLFRKKIILGVTGSIAAYKSAALTRLLVKAGAEVRVLMVESARDFITPLTLHTLSKNPVHTSFTLGPQGEWVNHVELGLWADAMIIAPASANTLAQCANGLCHNLLSAVYLSARCPVFFAPAMDVDMWKHPATQQNIHQLTTNGNFIIEPGKLWRISQWFSRRGGGCRNPKILLRLCRLILPITDSCMEKKSS